MAPKIGIVLIAFGSVLFIIGVILGWAVFPDKLQSEIEESVALVNGTEAFERWEELPLPILYKVYFFNVTNPEGVQTGERPVLEEVGPYVYTSRRSKYAIEDGIDPFDNLTTLSYYQKQVFEFDTEASHPLNETDEITIANLPLMSIVQLVEETSGNSLGVVNKYIPQMFDNPTDLFLRTTPRDFLFDGIHIRCNFTTLEGRVLCRSIAFRAPITMPVLEDNNFRFSLFNHKNTTNDGRWTIYAGVEKSELLGNVFAWENSTTTSFWAENSTCNNLVGSDGTIFPPFRKPKSQMHVYETDICRSVQLHYTRDVTFAGMKGLRYITGDEMLASPSTRPENECFCLNKTKGITDDDGCLLDGAMELRRCQGAPVVLTYPHFYLADDRYQSTVEGLEPTEARHQTFIDIEPYTGTPLRGNKRFQLNIFFRAIERIELTSNLSTTLMPILWIDEGVELNDELIKMLDENLFRKLNILNGIKWGMVGGGATISVLALIWVVIQSRSSSSKNKS